MTVKAGFPGLLAALVATAWCGVAAGQEPMGDGEGVDSNLLWPVPGPSNFATLQSSDIVGHTSVSFGALFGFYRQPLGVDLVDPATGETSTDWVVEHAFTGDFLWAFGLFDWVQLGVALPVVFDQDGVGATPFQPLGTEAATYKLPGSALRDLRFDVKTRFVGGQAELPDRRNFGLALDLGLTLPTGDELGFSGDNGPVFFPTAVLDFHRCMFSAAINLGARIRAEKARLADLEVGHQGVAGAGVTGHFLKRLRVPRRPGLDPGRGALGDHLVRRRFGRGHRGSAGHAPGARAARSHLLARGRGHRDLLTGGRGP
jgi:hypothetical protein